MSTCVRQRDVETAVAKRRTVDADPACGSRHRGAAGSSIVPTVGTPASAPRSWSLGGGTIRSPRSVEPRGSGRERDFRAGLARTLPSRRRSAASTRTPGIDERTRERQRVAELRAVEVGGDREARAARGRSREAFEAAQARRPSTATPVTSEKPGDVPRRCGARALRRLAARAACSRSGVATSRTGTRRERSSRSTRSAPSANAAWSRRPCSSVARYVPRTRARPMLTTRNATAVAAAPGRRAIESSARRAVSRRSGSARATSRTSRGQQHGRRRSPRSRRRATGRAISSAPLPPPRSTSSVSAAPRASAAATANARPAATRSSAPKRPGSSALTTSAQTTATVEASASSAIASTPPGARSACRASSPSPIAAAASVAAPQRARRRAPSGRRPASSRRDRAATAARRATSAADPKPVTAAAAASRRRLRTRGAARRPARRAGAGAEPRPRYVRARQLQLLRRSHEVVADRPALELGARTRRVSRRGRRCSQGCASAPRSRVTQP